MDSIAALHQDSSKVMYGRSTAAPHLGAMPNSYRPIDFS
jgi:hypothetical protein